MALDTWHHIVGVREGNSLKLYVNGVSVNSSTPTIGNLAVNTNPVQFNAYASASYSNGLSLSNNAIFNTALSGPEVATLYNNGSPIRTLANIPQNSNLKAWYKPVSYTHLTLPTNREV